jgi:hypothetical protein
MTIVLVIVSSHYFLSGSVCFSSTVFKIVEEVFIFNVFTGISLLYIEDC